MSEFKGTLGPWSVHADTSIESELGGFICEAFGDSTSWEEDQANANLIATAPELLEALQHVLNVKRSEERGNYGAHVNYKKLENAINKALGLGTDK